MNCEEIGELLDAYAIGVADRKDSDAIERHVSDCVRCWEELSRAQQAAALLAISVPIEQPGPDLWRRIEREASRAKRTRAGIVPRLRRWLQPGQSALAGALGTAAAAALLFAGFVQTEVSDVRHENATLETQVAAAGQELQQVKQVSAVLAATDVDKIELEPVSRRTDGQAVYNWSVTRGVGFINCDGLPPLAAGEAYELWFAVGEDAIPAALFEPANGGCQELVFFSTIGRRPNGIGITIEPAATGSREPSSAWLFYAHFEE